MTKQFTIPCQFGGQTSPVTFYIGHPDPAHHPIKFQSDWLSSAKGGTVPQDLMMTLQKLHELALENNADFEELCYYSLVSATNNSSDGVSPDEITNYADEYVKKELAGEEISIETSNNTLTKNTSIDGKNNNTNEISDNSSSTTETNNKITSSNVESLTANNNSVDNVPDDMLLDEDLLLDDELIEDGMVAQNNDTKIKEKIVDDLDDDDDLLLEDDDENLEKSNVVKVANSEKDLDIDNSIDEDLLLDDDMIVDGDISK